MMALTRNKPMEVIIQEKALILHEKLIRLPSIELWRNYDISKPRRLKTQDRFLQKVFKLKSDYSLLNVPTEELLNSTNPIQMRTLRKECYLMNAMTKSKSSSVNCELKAAAIWRQFIPGI